MTVDDLSVQELVIVRVYDAPRELVWKAWSDAEALAQWWGPKGFTLNVAQLDFQPGGVFHYSMQPPSGPEMWGKFVYQEIVAPERLTFINSFANADGDVIPNPWIPTWPLRIFNTLTLVAEDGKTKMTLRGLPFEATDEEQKTFENARGSMEQGFKGTLDQLAAYLAKA